MQTQPGNQWSVDAIDKITESAIRDRIAANHMIQGTGVRFATSERAARRDLFVQLLGMVAPAGEA